MKRKSEFRQMFKAPRVDWCALMSGSTKSNLMMKGLVEIFKRQMPHFIHKCPYFGRYEAFNVTVNTKLLSMYPPGIYRFQGKVVDETVKASWNGSFIYELDN